ncbi:hypothetical protein QYF31_04650 [Staphylococcus haemolyticus]
MSLLSIFFEVSLLLSELLPHAVKTKARLNIKNKIIFFIVATLLVVLLSDNDYQYHLKLYYFIIK